MSMLLTGMKLGADMFAEKIEPAMAVQHIIFLQFISKCFNVSS
jgi:hypothetical protein